MALGTVRLWDSVTSYEGLNASGFCIAFGTGTGRLKNLYCFTILKDVSLGTDYRNWLLFCYLNGIKIIGESEYSSQEDVTLRGLFLFCGNSFHSASTYISHLILIIVLLFPFYRWGHRVSEKISDFLRVTQLIDGQALVFCLLVHSTTLSLWRSITDFCLKWLLVTDAVVLSGENIITSSIFSQPSLPAPTAFPAPADPAPARGAVTDRNPDFGGGEVHPGIFPWSNHPHYAAGCISSFSSYLL